MKEQVNNTMYVDEAVYGDDWIKCYWKGHEVGMFTQVTDIEAIDIYDDKGKRIVPIPATSPANTHFIPDLSNDEIELVRGLKEGLGCQDTGNMRELGIAIGEALTQENSSLRTVIASDIKGKS